MVDFDHLPVCDGCGVEITWAPVLVKRTGEGATALVHKPLVYCCELCAQGLPCTCAERMELDDERRGYNKGDATAAM